MPHYQYEPIEVHQEYEESWGKDSDDNDDVPSMPSVMGRVLANRSTCNCVEIGAALFHIQSSYFLWVCHYISLSDS